MNARFQQWQQTAGLRIQQAQQALAPRVYQVQQSINPRLQRMQQVLQPRIQQVQHRIEPLRQRVRIALQQPRNRLFVAVAGGGVLVLVTVGIIAGNYIFGGSDYRVNHGPITAPTLVATGSGTLLTLDQSSTTASFTIQEVLFGKPKTVVGKTDRVAGQVLVDRDHPNESKVSTIRIDVSSLTTDDPRRNHTLQTRILQSNVAANQYATFVPSSYSGMPATVSIGKPFSFQVHGNLTVHQITKPEVFTMTALLKDATHLNGTATATVQRKDFNLVIPNIPFVTNVGNSFVLSLAFSANPTGK